MNHSSEFTPKIISKYIIFFSRYSRWVRWTWGGFWSFTQTGTVYCTHPSYRRLHWFPIGHLCPSVSIRKQSAATGRGPHQTQVWCHPTRRCCAHRRRGFLMLLLLFVWRIPVGEGGFTCWEEEVRGTDWRDPLCLRGSIWWRSGPGLELRLRLSRGSRSTLRGGGADRRTREGRGDIAHTRGWATVRVDIRHQQCFQKLQRTTGATLDC